MINMRNPAPKAINGRTVFPWALWRWTGDNEDLFTLTEEELVIFEILTEEASKAESWTLPAWSQRELFMESA